MATKRNRCTLHAHQSFSDASIMAKLHSSWALHPHTQHLVIVSWNINNTNMKTFHSHHGSLSNLSSATRFLAANHAVSATRQEKSINQSPKKTLYPTSLRDSTIFPWFECSWSARPGEEEEHAMVAEHLRHWCWMTDSLWQVSSLILVKRGLPTICTRFPVCLVPWAVPYGTQVKMVPFSASRVWKTQVGCCVWKIACTRAR